ncbi:sodium:solute symporter family protein [Brevibacillus humidisoli]|uniref:sodium:solute symporter family protein n=1 Tax=Brevibacillus humidisoli TaxID=2895522 RepID=UPI001E3F255C|nr:sodium:solute symporter family protein [Brevibacillus humidisoli]UFJ41103.1 sodium:solute symporter family protein [Brevibacillus humidisoli]
MYDPLLYLGFFVLYTILILIFGRHGFDRSKSLKDFFIANQRLGTWSSVSTFGATWFSAASMLGFTGLVYSYGYSEILFTTVCWFLGAALMVLVVDKLYDFGAVTVPEFFRIRYGSTTLQILSGLILLFSYILYIVIQIQGFGIVIGELLDVPYTVGIFLVFLFIIYTTFGGLHSVARTDMVNFILIVVGSIVAAFLVLDEVGGISRLHAAVGQQYVTFGKGTHDPFSPLPEGMWSIAAFISSFFALGLGLAANPQYVVRIWSARNKRTAYRMIAISILLLSVVYLSLAIVGMGGKILVPAGSVANDDEVFPYMMTEFISSPLKGIILISIVAASISTANSQLLLLASSVIYDVYQSVRKTALSDRRLLIYTRWLIVLLATCSLLLSLTPLNDLVGFSGQVWGIIASTFFFPLFGGLLWKKANSQGAILSFVGGMATYLISFLLIPEDVSRYVHPAVPSVIVSGILFFSQIRRS